MTLRVAAVSSQDYLAFAHLSDVQRSLAFLYTTSSTNDILIEAITRQNTLIRNEYHSRSFETIHDRRFVSQSRLHVVFVGDTDWMHYNITQRLWRLP